MERLIAQRPIQYMGRTYEAGAPVPAGDPRMVEAWLEAGSAAWSDAHATKLEIKTPNTAPPTVNDLAAAALRALGVAIEDSAGEFVGAEALEEQIRALSQKGQETPQDGADGQDGQEPAGEEKGGQEGTVDAPEGEMFTGHLDAEDLAKWKKADLEKLAQDMGVDISTAKNNAERAAILAAVEVQAPVDGGAQ